MAKHVPHWGPLWLQACWYILIIHCISLSVSAYQMVKSPDKTVLPIIDLCIRGVRNFSGQGGGAMGGRSSRSSGPMSWFIDFDWGNSDIVTTHQWSYGSANVGRPTCKQKWLLPNFYCIRIIINVIFFFSFFLDLSLYGCSWRCVFLVDGHPPPCAPTSGTLGVSFKRSPEVNRF